MRYLLMTGPGIEEEVVALPEAETETEEDLEETPEVFGLSGSRATDSAVSKDLDMARDMGTEGMGERVLG